MDDSRWEEIITNLGKLKYSETRDGIKTRKGKAINVTFKKPVKGFDWVLFTRTAFVNSNSKNGNKTKETIEEPTWDGIIKSLKN